ncbi:hypothetical protein ABVT39_015472 [Epinephelus coioides]
METALITHSDNITSLEQDGVELCSKLTSITEERCALQAAVEDLVSRSKRQNLRVISLPKDIEGQPAETSAISGALLLSVIFRIRYGFDELVVGTTSVFDAPVFFTSIRISVLFPC